MRALSMGDLELESMPCGSVRITIGQTPTIVRSGEGDVVRLRDWLTECIEHVATPTFDTDGYPTAETLQAVTNWKSGIEELVEFLSEAWNMQYGSWKEEWGSVVVSTGGWSGNEDLIEALQQNTLAWHLLWEKSERGGTYEFRLPG